MDGILSALARVGEFKFNHDDDFIDRVSRTYTTAVLLLFALLVSTKQYVGDPITCWCPAQFRESHMAYANKICWVTNTYYLPFDKRVPSQMDPKKKLTYYQWIPMILITQAVLFYIPCFVWRVFNKRSGVNVKVIMEAADASQRAQLAESKNRTLRYLVFHLDSYLGKKFDAQDTCFERIKSGFAAKCGLVCGKLYGNYLVMLYLNVKLLYLVNAVGQLFMLNAFLGTDYHLYGVTIMKSLLRGEDWTSPDRFPRVTLCNFRIRQLVHVNKYTVQCVLPINLFNEKIFIFIWVWFVFVAILTAFSFVYWTIRALYKPTQTQYVKKQLKAMDRLNRETDLQMTKFTDEYLKQDGVFVCRLIAKNCGSITAAEILCLLWDNYCKENRLLVDPSNAALRFGDREGPEFR